jgi:hypothetical protein
MRRGTRSAILFFVIGFCTCLVMIGFVRYLTRVDWNFPLHKERTIVKAVLYPLGECPHCKAISHQYWHVDKLNDDNNVHLEAARRMGLRPFSTNASFEQQKDALVRARKLVLLNNCDTYVLKDLTHSYPYLVPAAVELLNEIGERFEMKLERLGIPPYQMQISSVLRTLESQNGLGHHNTNAASESAHTYATTFDITYKEFVVRNGGRVKEGYCRHDMMRHVLAEVLTEMRNEGRCKVVIERKQACFHVTVCS